jgi:hypothetical protein
LAVLAMLELDGDSPGLMAASAKLDELRPRVDGLLLRMAAPTVTGMVLFQLWESPEARQRNQDDPTHSEALQTSGMEALVKGSRATTFEDVELRRIAVTEAPR